MIELNILQFEAPFRFGWRIVYEFIDSSSITRALIRMAIHIGIQDSIVKSLREDKLKISSLLPLLPLGETLRILVPFPTLPIMKKAHINWITVSYLETILKFIAKCIHNDGEPLLERKDNEFILTCLSTQDIIKLNIASLADRTFIAIDDCNSTCLRELKTLMLFKHVVEYHNRLDRVSLGSDLYNVDGIRPLVPLWIAIQGDHRSLKEIEKLLILLQDLGLGGRRRFGWGKYVLENDLIRKIHERDIKVLKTMVNFEGMGLYFLLGRYAVDKNNLIDLRKSFYNIVIAEGFTDFHNIKPLPRTPLLEVGSVLFTRSRLKNLFLYGDVDEYTGYHITLPLTPIACGIAI